MSARNPFVTSFIYEPDHQRIVKAILELYQEKGDLTFQALSDYTYAGIIRTTRFAPIEEVAEIQKAIDDAIGKADHGVTLVCIADEEPITIVTGAVRVEHIVGEFS